ncbi:radical SAM protein [Streptomyces sp. NPDC003077]|uniref:radical SAM protein n=1 Tax=Streptomyces sp. NPDC003077 TaxID=3154443 RepID=UPI0033AA1D98
MPGPVEIQDALRIVDPQEMHLILLPTEQCNFRCTYCYEQFPVARMRPTVIRGVKALMARRAGALRFLELGWFGGEPLLAKPVVLDVSAYAQELARRNPGLVYAGSMTTNAYLLTEPVARELVAVGVRSFHISLDGPEDVHDQSRLRINGQGSFRRIWTNLQAIADSDLECSVILRIHYSPETYLRLDPLIDQINDAFGDDTRFSVYFKDIERLGGEGDDAIRLFSEDANHDIQAALNSKLRMTDRVYSEARNGVYICYASRANSLIVRHDGSLGKCTVALYDERNTVGKISEDGSLVIDHDRFRPWLVGLSTLDPADLGCPYSSMNTGVKPDKDREDVRYLPIVATT